MPAQQDNLYSLFSLQKPLEHGADLVMHSASKYLGGHADLVMGVLATSQESLFNDLWAVQRYRGATPSAFDCYLLQRSLQTLEVSSVGLYFGLCIYYIARDVSFSMCNH